MTHWIKSPPLTAPAWGPKFWSPAPRGKSGMAVHPCNYNAQEDRDRRTLKAHSLVSQPRNGELQVQLR